MVFSIFLYGNGSWNKKNNGGVLVKSTRGGRFGLAFVNKIVNIISVEQFFCAPVEKGTRICQ